MGVSVLVAGGGTGGHLFPGVAVAEELLASQPGSDVVFVGTDKGIEARVIPELGYPLELIEISGIRITSYNVCYTKLLRDRRRRGDGPGQGRVGAVIGAERHPVLPVITSYSIHYTKLYDSHVLHKKLV